MLTMRDALIDVCLKASYLARRRPGQHAEAVKYSINQARRLLRLWPTQSMLAGVADAGQRTRPQQAGHVLAAAIDLCKASGMSGPEITTAINDHARAGAHPDDIPAATIAAAIQLAGFAEVADVDLEPAVADHVALREHLRLKP